MTRAMKCGMPPCAEHGELCAFHGNEPDRCPVCHCLWPVSIRRRSHSCEWSRFRTKAQRLAAEAARREYERKPWRGEESTHCSHRALRGHRMSAERLTALNPWVGMGSAVGAAERHSREAEAA